MVVGYGKKRVPRNGQRTGHLEDDCDSVYAPVNLDQVAMALQATIQVSPDGAGGQYVVLQANSPFLVSPGPFTRDEYNQPLSVEALTQLALTGTTDLAVNVPHGGIIGVYPIGEQDGYRYSPGGYRHLTSLNKVELES